MPKPLQSPYGLSLALVCCLFPTQAASRPALGSELEVTYLANEGVYLSDGSRGVLIDALFTDGVRGYSTLAPELRRSLESGAPPFDDVVLALATHSHADHFDPVSVARFLKSHPHAHFASTPQAIRRLVPETEESDRDRIHSALPSEGHVESLTLGGVEIELLNLHHGRGGEPPTQNLGIVVTLADRRILHIGDTEARERDFRPLALGRIDVGLLPYWFLLKPHYLEVTRQEIEPTHVVALHMPTTGAPKSYFDGATDVDDLAKRIQHHWPGAEVAVQTLQTWFPLRLAAD